MQRTASILFFTIALLIFKVEGNVIFKDVSIESGMKRPYGRRAKYGGPAIADLNGDGKLDLLFTHHNHNCTDYYLNEFTEPSKVIKFKRVDWQVCADVHGIIPFRYSTLQKTMSFLVTRGGSLGTKLNTPLLYSVNSNGETFREDLVKAGLDPDAGSRGRSALFFHADKDKVDKVFSIITSAPLENLGILKSQKIFELDSNQIFELKTLTGGFENESNSHVSAIDVNNDGFMEVLTMSDLNVYYNDQFQNYKISRVSQSLLPRHLRYNGVSAVAEFDFDNDGFMDLYLARTNKGHLKWRGNKNQNDLLLKNVGGKKFVDVTETSNIPLNTQSNGVTTGDFNNDGYIDLFISRFEDGPDLILYNNKGDGTFSIRNANIQRDNDIVKGDMASAVDLNNDGKLDLVVSEGHWDRATVGGGYYRIIQNTTPSTELGNFLLVRVKNSPSSKVTSLHALVKVYWKNGQVLSRRVGGTSGTLVSVSYIETLHFGVGDSETLDLVQVIWVGGEKEEFENVKSNQLLTIGS